MPVFELELGVTQIPCQMLIGWSDIMKYGMLNELVKLGNVQIPVVNEIAPEELVEDEFGAIALSARKGSEVVEVDPDVKKWMQLYPEVMSEVLPSEPAKLEPIKLKLKEGHQLPVSSPPYQQSQAVERFIEETVTKLLEQKFIVPSTSPVASPVVVVKDPNKDWRMCIDFRKINDVIEGFLFPIPNLKKLVFRVGGKKFYAKFDFRKGYHQLLVAIDSRYLTAFICESGQYEFVRLPFGLKCAPAYFQWLVSTQVLTG